MTTQGYRENNAFDRDGLLVNLGFEAGASHKLNLLINYISTTELKYRVPWGLRITKH